MSGEIRKRRRYNMHMNAENPLQNIPKTTKWRMRRRNKEPDQQAGPSSNVTEISYGDDDHMEQGDIEEPCQEESKGDEHQDPHCLPDDEWHQCSDDNFNHVWLDMDNAESVDSSDEIPDQDNEPFTDKGDQPIYKGAAITVAQSALLILSFALRHNLTGECLSDLLTLISFHCLASNIILKSLYHFKSYFSNLKAPLVFHHYCTACDILVNTAEGNCQICHSDLSKKNSVSYFVEIPLAYQVEQFFKRPGFHELLLHRFSRKKKFSQNIEDIYDGQLYSRHFREDASFLQDKNIISFMWYTDGVPLFKSSKISIWPIFLAINELPPNERMKQENMIFLGMWFGKSKPSMASYMKPFHDSLEIFSSKGMSVFCPHCNDEIAVKGMLLCGTCDLPAKSIVMNMTQFNGKHGCPKCKQEGKVVKTGKGHTRVFPFDGHLVGGLSRAHSEFVSQGTKAFQTSKPVFGVKGPSWWVNINIDIINGTGIDYMHTVLLGMVRKLLALWFDSKFSGEAFSVSNYVSVADKRLSEIKPPYFIKRHPRGIADHSQYWKASECRAWLFYYSVPVMFGILTKEFFEHYLLFVEAMYLLNLDSISPTHLKLSEELIMKFCGLFSVLYGEQHMSANLHQILHLPKNVKELGPLWVYSCFSFESLNGKLVQLFHGTQNAVVQIANAVSAMMKLPQLADHIKEESHLWHFYNKLSSARYHFTITETILPGIYVLGTSRPCILNETYKTAIAYTLQTAQRKYCMFYRILFNGVLFQSVKYNVSSRNSYTVMYRTDDGLSFGQIQFFAKCFPLCACSKPFCKCEPSYVAVLLKIDTDEECIYTHGNHDHIKATLCNSRSGQLSTQLIGIPITSITDLVVCVGTKDKKLCLSMRPNKIEGD